MSNYEVSLDWTGSTADPAGHDRSHRGRVPAAGAELGLTADPAFGGDPTRLNPEQLLVLAAASCQLLTFLAAAARSRLDVVAYADDARGFMPADERPVRITRIELRPRISVRGGEGDREALVERVRRLCDIAHRGCFIANSVNAEFSVEPEITVVS